METKTWTISEEKQAAQIEIREHFGWVKVSSTAATLTMKREKTNVSSRLASLEKQYDYLSKKVPAGAISCLAIGVICLIPGLILYGKIIIGFMFLLAGLICAAIGIALLVVFLIIGKHRKNLIKDIFNEADELSGKRVSLPLRTNMKKPDQRSFEIKKAVYNGELKA